ncbi:MAG: alpha/beta hydrolase [Rubrivivax sp.]|nr:alpha/beta hydrolase [Rubrivivax sp.]
MSAAKVPGERTYERLLGRLAALPKQTSLTLDELRTQYDSAERAFRVDPGCVVEIVDEAPFRGECLRPGQAGEAAMLYLHGGGYVIGSPRSHRHLVADLAAATRLTGYLLDYRLAPEHPYPAARDDAVAAVRWLLETGRTRADRLVLAGDSAGGGLVVATLVALRDAGLPMPAAAICLSPWVDLSCSLPSCASNRPPDPVIDGEVLRAMARAYLGRRSPRTPGASPLFADLRGLPPLLVQAAADEVLTDEAVELARAAAGAEVAVTLEQWPRFVHVGPWYARVFDDGRRAIDHAARFVSAALEQASPGRAPRLSRRLSARRR